MTNGAYGDDNTLFGYAPDIQPKEVDPVNVRFEGDKGGAICFYLGCKGVDEKLIAEPNHAFPSKYFEKIPDLTTCQSNTEWAERQILQQALAKICGIKSIPNEDGISFVKRIEPYEGRWKRQQC